MIDIAGGFIFLILLGSYVFNHFISRPKHIANPRMAITKANDILRKKIHLPESALNTTATSSACTLFLRSSAESSMVDYANQFIDHNVDEILKTCNGAIPSDLQKKIDDALQVCKTSTREKITNECYAALMQAKTKSVATVIRPDIDPRTLDSTILLHLIADKFSSGEFFEHPDLSLAIVDALLEKEPNYLSGYKVKLLLLSMSSLSKEDQYKDIYQDTMDEALRLRNNDPDLKEIGLAVRGDIFNQSKDENRDNKEFQKEFMNYLEQESQIHPKDWIYDYYRANALYDGGKGNYQQTLALVENALKKSPNDMRLKQTLENLKSDDDVKRKHPFIISIGFSLNDL